MIAKAALACAALSFAVAAHAEEKLLATWEPEDWQSVVDHPSKAATAKEEKDGYTRIIYHRRRIPGGINSRVEQEVWEDGNYFDFFDGHGKAAGTAGDAANSPLVTARIFQSREVYYAVDNPWDTQANRNDQIDYTYEIFEIRRDRSTHYKCMFRSRLSQIASPRELRKVVNQWDDGLQYTISAYLTEHGADLAADKCRIAR